MTLDPNLPSDPANALLDEASRAIRDDAPPETTSHAARRAAWSFLVSHAATTEACQHARPHLSDLAEGSLDADRATLVADHCRECATCREALNALRHPATALASSPAALPVRPRARRALAAAAAVLIVGLAAGASWKLLRQEATEAASLSQVEGIVLADRPSGATLLAAGATLPAGELLRTTRASRAVLSLPDGSSIEMNERSELAFEGSSSGLTVRLVRGDIIVNAAERRSGHLDVVTDDCRATVTGTVFTVGHGLKGSRVGVLKGSVRIAGAGARGDRVLEAGEQYGTRPALVPVALVEQVAWSDERERYIRLLSEMDAAAREVAALPAPERRTHVTELLDVLPEGTVFVAALPNDGNLARVVERLEQRIAADPTLSAWWQDQIANDQSATQPSFASLAHQIGQLSAALGDDVIVSLSLDASGLHAPPVPALIASVRDEALLRTTVEELSGAAARTSGRAMPGLTDAAGLRSRAAASDAGHDPLLVLSSGHLLAGPSAAALEAMAGRLDRREPSTFASTDFHRDVLRRLEEGGDLVIAADLARLIDRASPTSGPHADAARAHLDALGISRLDRFTYSEGRDDAGTAVLSFRDTRTGLMSWLAEPAPMGSLQFVTADASLVVASVSRDPLALLTELQESLGDQEFPRVLSEFRDHVGVDLLDDIAAPIGGEAAFAIDGPLLPTPSWKLILDVVDDARLQATLQRLVVAASEHAQGERFEIVTDADSRGVVHVMRRVGGDTLACWTSSDGYLVATPNRALLETALQARALGRSLATAPRFQALLPHDGEQYFSVLGWADLGSIVQQIPGGALAAAGMPGLSVLAGAGDAGPVLVHGRASERAITFQLGSLPGESGGRIGELLRSILLRSMAADALAAGATRPESGSSSQDTRGAVRRESGRRL